MIVIAAPMIAGITAARHARLFRHVQRLVERLRRTCRMATAARTIALPLRHAARIKANAAMVVTVPAVPEWFATTPPAPAALVNIK